MKTQDKQKLEYLLLESVYLMRWNETKTALSAVLEPEEAMEIVFDIFYTLHKNGYKLIKETTNDKIRRNKNRQHTKKRK